MTPWSEVSLGEIFDISSSKRVLQEDWKSSGVPFYRAREIVKLAKEGHVQNELFISEELYENYRNKYGSPKPGDLMISAVGTLGACYVVQPTDRFYYKDASVLRLSPKREVCSTYIQHAFRTSEVLDQVHASSGSTVGTYTIQRANTTRIKLPPLPEQRRIAAILDQADALRAKRREALAQLDSLTQSIFVEMFGDPVTNPKDWPLLTFGSQFESVRYGTGSPPAYVEHGIPFIRATNIKAGRINVKDLKNISVEDANKLAKCRVNYGNMIVVRSGVNTGDCAVIPTEYDGSCAAFDLIVDIEYPNAVFFSFMINSEYGQRILEPLTRRAAQPHLNAAQLQSLLLITPPAELRNDFAARIDAVETIRIRQNAALSELDSLFASLQHQAFRGEL